MAQTTKRKKSGHPAKKNHSAPNKLVKPTPAMWIAGARIRTLPLAISPVALGTASASLVGEVNYLLAGLCLAVALFLQIGVNYANDYSDGIRGTDAFRLGPPRLTGSGVAHPRRVLIVAAIFFALGAAAGLAIAIITGQYWLLVVGAAAIAAGYFYTGGKHPYGYYGLGELAVFLFFGVVATVGTDYILSGEFSFEGIIASIAAGVIACAVLMANNIRDRDSDKAVGKKTLAVLVGNLPARIIYLVFMLIAYGVLYFFSQLFPLAPLVFFTLLLAVPAGLIVMTGKTPKELLLALKLTSLTGLLFGVGLAAAIAF